MGTRTLVSGQLSSPEVGLPCFYSRTQAHLRSFRHTGNHAGKSNIVQGCSCHPKGRRANFHVQKLERQHVVTSAQQATETSSNLTQQPDLQDPEATNLELPCLAGGGGGIFFFWQLGAIKYLLQHYEADKMQFVGASAGALVATIAACRVDPEAAVECAYRISKEAGLWDRKLGLLGIWGRLIRQWLDEILPADAHNLSRGRLRLVGTDVFGRKQVHIQGVKTREDLIQANMCSIHIPFFLDLRLLQYYKGTAFVDGSLTDFLFWENGELLTCGGRSFVLDYSLDAELSFQRLDFLKLRSYESVLELFNQGFAYAEREDKSGSFDQYFGAVRVQR